ncbi:hypothetical protein TNCV_1801511 [Trichonephila clavipes]|nr:hypothetical protein TNCV_1801511 [Trichonephila clavipes]
MCRRKSLSPDEIDNLLQEPSENEPVGGELFSSNLDFDEDIRLSESDYEESEVSADVIDRVPENSDIYVARDGTELIPLNSDVPGRFQTRNALQWYNKLRVTGIDSVEDEEPAGRPRSVIREENIGKIRHVSRLPFTSIVSDGWMLYQENAPAYTALCVKQFLIPQKLMGHLPYSPDLAPCDRGSLYC